MNENEIIITTISIIIFLWSGRNQVLVGLVPCLNPVYNIESAKSVYPLAIANCKENRFIINFYYFMLLKYFFSFAWRGYKVFNLQSRDTFL